MRKKLFKKFNKRLKENRKRPRRNLFSFENASLTLKLLAELLRLARVVGDLLGNWMP